jgi:hypothetical protein
MPPPLEITERLWITGDLSAFLRRGGVTGITMAERLRRAFERSQRLTGSTQWKCRRWNNTQYYLLGKALKDFTPKTQFEHFQNPQHCLSTLHNDYFLWNTRASGKFLHDIEMAEPSLLFPYETHSLAVSHEEDNGSNTEGNDIDSDEEEKEAVLMMTPKGYKLVSIDQETNFFDALQEHAQSCQCKMNLLIQASGGLK